MYKKLHIDYELLRVYLALHSAGLVTGTGVWEALRSGPVPSGGQGVTLADPRLSVGVVQAGSLRFGVRLWGIPLSLLRLWVNHSRLCQLFS